MVKITIEDIISKHRYVQFVVTKEFSQNNNSARSQALEAAAMALHEDTGLATYKTSHHALAKYISKRSAKPSLPYVIFFKNGQPQRRSTGSPTGVRPLATVLGMILREVNTNQTAAFNRAEHRMMQPIESARYSTGAQKKTWKQWLWSKGGTSMKLVVAIGVLGSIYYYFDPDVYTRFMKMLHRTGQGEQANAAPNPAATSWRQRALTYFASFKTFKTYLNDIAGFVYTNGYGSRVTWAQAKDLVSHYKTYDEAINVNKWHTNKVTPVPNKDEIMSLGAWRYTQFIVRTNALSSLIFAANMTTMTPQAVKPPPAVKPQPVKPPANLLEAKRVAAQAAQAKREEQDRKKLAAYAQEAVRQAAMNKAAQEAADAV